MTMTLFSKPHIFKMNLKQWAGIAVMVIANQFVYSQPYKHLPDSNVVWGIYRSLYGNWSEYYFSTNNQRPDTIINSKVYTKVYEHWASVTYYGAYRSTDSGQVYIVPPDSINEFKIYDFSGSAGDTLKDIFYYRSLLICSFADFIIDSIKIVTYGSVSRKKIFLHHANFLSYPFYWIEGVGGPGGFVQLPTYEYYEDYFYLDCMSSNDTLWWPEYNYGNQGQCDTLIINSINEMSYGINVFPNPAMDKISILLGEDLPILSGIRLIDIYGQLIEPIKFNIFNDKIVIDVSQVNPGAYFLVIKTRNASYRSKIVKI